MTATARPATEQGTLGLVLSRESLSDTLALLAAVVPANPTLPVLANVLVEATADGELAFVATDLDLWVRVARKADVLQPGRALIPAKQLHQIAKTAAPAPIEIAVRDDGKVAIRVGRARFKLAGLPAHEYPSWPAISFDGASTVPPIDFLDMAGRTSFCVSTEESRPVLNGVLCESTPSGLRLVATNGHRLALAERACERVTAIGSGIILPKKALAVAAKLFTGEDEIEIAAAADLASTSLVGLRSAAATLVSRLIEGPYPNYERVIPKDSDRTATIDRHALMGALRRMTIIASNQTHLVRLSFAEGKPLGIAAMSPDLGSANETLPITYEGRPLKIGFNANYLLDELRALSADEVLLEMGEPERAVIVRDAAPVGEVRSFYLLMPVRLIDGGPGDGSASDA